MGTGTAAVAPTAAAPAEPDLLDDNGQPMTGGEPALLDDNGHPLGQSPLDDPNSLASRAALSRRNQRLAMMLPPPEPPDDSLLGGVLKGAQSTGTSILKLAKGAVHGDFGPYDQPEFQDEYTAAQTPHGAAGNVGFYGEKLAELLAPMGLASRGAKAIAAGADLVAPSGRVLAELPAAGRLGRAAITAGVEGASNAAVTGLQTGDPSAAGWAGAAGALTALPLKYWSKAERVKALLDGVINPALAKPGAEAGVALQESLAGVHKAAGQVLDREYGDVISRAAAAGNPTIALDQPGVATAQRLLSELEGGVKNVPGLGTIDDVNKARGILQDMITEAQSNSGVTVADAIKRRTFLRDLSRSPIFQTSTGKGALQQLTQAWHDSMTSALDNASPGLGKQFARASAQYRQFIDTFNSGTIRRLVRAKAPDAILDTLLGSTGETTANNLRQLIPPADMEAVRASLWKRVLDRASSSSDRTFSAKEFSAITDKMSPEAQRAVFGSAENVSRMTKFAQMMDNNWIRRAADTPIVGSVMRPGIVGRMVMGAGAGVMGDRVLDHDESGGGWKVWGPAGALMSISPIVAAKLLARPGTINVLEKAASTSPASTAGRMLASRVASLVMGVALTGGQGEQDRKATSATINTPTSPAAMFGVKPGTSALVTGPPQPETSDEQTPPQTGQTDFGPAENSGYLENTKPSLVLPARFKTALSATMASPRKIGATDVAPGGPVEQEDWQGRYLSQPDTVHGLGANTALVSRSAGAHWTETLYHELGHAIYEKDLTGQERAAVGKYFDDFAHERVDWGPQTEAAFNGPGQRKVGEFFPELVSMYVTRPSVFKQEAPEGYALVKRIFGGREYIRK